MIMDIPRASITAEIMAIHRATEMLRPEEERVCQDTLAIHFLSQEAAEIMRDRQRLTELAKENALNFPGINGAVVARTRFIDEIVLKYLEEGVDQIVILGAGYDSRAYRIESVKEEIVIFELDHPLTQQIKKKKIADIFGRLPEHVHYVPVDFTKDDLGVCLQDNGYDASKKSLFIMEGLIFYLPSEAIEHILMFIAEYSGPTSGIVFDYLPPSVIEGTSDRVEGRNSWLEVQRSGEPYKTGFESGSLSEFLAQKGFVLKENVNAPGCRDWYFRGQSRQRQITPIFWFAHAVVRTNR
jgi:methyltransferase (TIGR00027 family)